MSCLLEFWSKIRAIYKTAVHHIFHYNKLTVEYNQPDLTPDTQVNDDHFRLCKLSGIIKILIFYKSVGQQNLQDTTTLDIVSCQNWSMTCYSNYQAILITIN